ncbi:MAG: B12-binding domain-containing protein [Chlorobia bacterium]|nr:B12-binding domain-containing protein [Fimbriimonadaceae bacterium]
MADKDSLPKAAPQEELTVVYDPLIELMSRFENVKATNTSSDPFEGLGVEDRLKKHIIDGIKKNLEKDIEDALQVYEPLAIINDILLDGMKTVGVLFGSGKMQLPFVLQSAEVMKTSVRQLEPLMAKVEGSEKGSILLATVQGDVHDIGKNLVDIILSNNGYRVVNIGIKQPINNILDAAREHQCQVIGLSGLLVKSTLIMRDNLLEMNERGLHEIPVILGGAALTRGYVEQDLQGLYHGRVFYAQDAFEGLKLMGELTGDQAEVLDSSVEDKGSISIEQSSNPAIEQSPTRGPEGRVNSHRVGIVDPELFVFDGTKSEIQPVTDPPKLPFYGAKKFEKFDIFEIYKYINPIALFRGQWQYKRPEGLSNPEFEAWLQEQAGPIFERMKRELANVLKPKVKWGYFPCSSEGNDLIIYREDRETEWLRFNFPRQRDGKRQCLADFFLEGDDSSAHSTDVVGFHVVTVGEDVSTLERKLFADGKFEDYLYVHGMGVETAEALAEYWHRQIRQEMGIGDQEPDEMRLLFSAKYHGARYSFGYPACPNLEDQAKLFELLQPQDIGIELSEEFMLIPEQSTSAIIVHHPDAKYFNIR